MRKAFICTNEKQLLGAKLAMFALTKASSGQLPVEIIKVEEQPIFQNFVGKTYKRGSENRTYRFSDLQSFTLTRFMPPQLTNWNGQALVIDPDIFAIKNPLTLFSFVDKETPIAACEKGDAWDTSVMVLECAQLKHWDMRTILESLETEKMNYTDYMSLKKERVSIRKIPRTWNSLDVLDEQTDMLHTTNRLTQPWKTGLPIDFTRNKSPKILGIFPREPFLKFFNKYPTNYQPHPNKEIEKFFFGLAKDALTEGFISKEDVESAIMQKHIRPDFYLKLAGK